MRKVKFRKISTGNAAIEFAIIAPIVFLIVSGIVNLGLIIINKSVLAAVASAGIFYAIGISNSTSAIQTAMQASTTSVSPLTATATQFCECVDGSKPGCNATCPDGSTIGTYVTVTAQSQVTLFALAFTPASPFATQAKATIRIN